MMQISWKWGALGETLESREDMAPKWRQGYLAGPGSRWEAAGQQPGKGCGEGHQGEAEELGLDTTGSEEPIKASEQGSDMHSSVSKKNLAEFDGRISKSWYLVLEKARRKPLFFRVNR